MPNSTPGHGRSKKATLRRFYREYRKAGAPFVLAHKLSKARFNYKVTDLLNRLGGYDVVPHMCGCCGPP